MITQKRLIELALELPGTEPGTSWDQDVVKVGKTALFWWNPTYACPVFGVGFDERDFLIEADPDTFFTTDHHRNYPLVLARCEGIDEDWVRARLKTVWLAKAPKKLLKMHEAALRD